MRSRIYATAMYHILMTAATIGIPSLIYFGSRGQGNEAYYGAVGAVMAFLLLVTYLILPEWENRR
ncbi:hypothetical protein [Paludifilum halophilum]|nr:hypothetical protein [Paludifilum halophilum]